MKDSLLIYLSLGALALFCYLVVVIVRIPNCNLQEVKATVTSVYYQPNSPGTYSHWRGRAAIENKSIEYVVDYPVEIGQELSLKRCTYNSSRTNGENT